MDNLARKLQELDQNSRPELKVIEGGAKSPEAPHRHAGTASVIAGAVGMVAWIIPLFGLPITIAGLVQGLKVLRHSTTTAGLVGTILCSLGLFLTLGNAVIGAYLGATGQHALVNEILPRR